MKYEVIEYFTDLQDFNHPYKAGDTFPRDGMAVTQQRLDELASSNNKRGFPLIKAINEPKAEIVCNDFVVDGEKIGEVDGDVINVTNDKAIKETLKETKIYTKTDINTMNVADLRELAKENGIEDADEISGAKLKTMLIDIMGL